MSCLLFYYGFKSEENMKIDRLIGILSILLQEDKVTAPELAKRFEVSRRTINRDIEDLLLAGIPIVTAQGTGGGISIMDGYKMDKTILSTKDMQMILAGLRSLDSIGGSHYYGQLMEKLKAGSSEYIGGTESILIDLSSWHKDSLPPKIEAIQDAIELNKHISFEYYSPKGYSSRTIEPYYLVFKWTDWYVYGYCLLREDFRIFKLNRMTNISHGENFVKRSVVPLPEILEKNQDERIGTLKAIFDSSMKWHLIEEYGIESFEELPDGRLLFEHEYSDEDSVLSWMLYMQDKVTVLEPESIKRKLYEISSQIMERYKETENEKMV